MKSKNLIITVLAVLLVASLVSTAILAIKLNSKSDFLPEAAKPVIAEANSQDKLKEKLGESFLYLDANEYTSYVGNLTSSDKGLVLMEDLIFADSSSLNYRILFGFEKSAYLTDTKNPSADKFDKSKIIGENEITYYLSEAEGKLFLIALAEWQGNLLVFDFVGLNDEETAFEIIGNTLVR